MRQDPPFDMAYITATHMLERIHPKTLVVNDPAEVRNAPEKLFVTEFAEFIPPTLITSDLREIRAFRDEHKDIILKPLYGNGGAGVFRVKQDDENLGSLMEMFTQFYREPVIVQRYLPEVRKGDKRIILVDGEFAGAINRVPAAGEARSNMHVGGRPEATELTAREKAICAAIGPELKKRGPDLHRHRRDRRLYDRDQRHLAHRHPRSQALRRRRHRRPDLGRDRKKAQMITVRKSEDRGKGKIDWLDSRHSFSFGDYYDPAYESFGPLRVINEDWIKGGAGFPPHPHRDMEIVTYILDGAIAHKDSTGGGGTIRPGEIQRMSAGTGIVHAEFNASATETCHLLQIWIMPSKRGIAARL